LEKYEQRFLWGIIALLFTYSLQFTFHPTDLMISSMQDDTYYYLKIAQNITAGKSATFDGIHKTNGFHPLWLLVLTLLSAIPGLGQVGLIRIVLVLQALLFLGSLTLIKKNAKEVFPPLLIATLLMIPMYPRFFHIFHGGMESGLVIFLLLLILFLLPKIFSEIFSSKWHLYSLLLGALLTALVLTRLDTFFLPAVILSYILIIDICKHKSPTTASLGALLAGSVVVLGLLPFLTWNYTNFGTIATISSKMKVKWSLSGTTNQVLRMVTTYPEYFVGFAFAAIGIIIILLSKRYFNQEQRDRFLIPITLFAISSLLFLTFNFLFVKWGVFAYTFSFLLPVIVLGTAMPLLILLKELKSKRGGMLIMKALFIIAAISTLGTQTYSLSRREMGMTIRIYETAIYARENTPEGAIFAMKDCGVFGYYSQRTTINLDGLVNDFEYQEHLRSGQLEEYIQKNNVDYFVQHAFWFDDYPVNTGDYQQYSLYIPSRVYDGFGANITVSKEQEFYRSEFYQPRGQDATRVIIWRLG